MGAMLFAKASRKKSWFWKNRLGQYHRIDQAAIVYRDGTQEWYFNGELHRESGPAVICRNGHQEWYRHGLLHRTDGPAITCANGNQQWFCHGKNITKLVEEFLSLNIGEPEIWSTEERRMAKASWYVNMVFA